MSDYQGTLGNDTFIGTSDSEVISGGAGADTLSGGAGSDSIFAGEVSDEWSRPRFEDPGVAPLLDTGTDRDSLSGGVGSDAIFAGWGDSVDGGLSDDILFISFMGADHGVNADFRGLEGGGEVTIEGAVIRSIEAIFWLEGSGFDDVLAPIDGDIAPIYARGGNDHVIAAITTGNVYGGQGNDLLDMTLAEFQPYTYGEAGNDTLLGGAGTDVMYGGDDQDVISGSDGSDSLFGGSGRDTLSGGGGDDVLDGGSGVDTVVFGHAFSSYSVVSVNGTFRVTNTGGDEGADTLENFERYEFLDFGVAFDLDGSAGKTAKLIGALLGQPGLQMRDVVAKGLEVFDEGLTSQQVADAAVQIVYGSVSDFDFVSAVYINLAHVMPSPEAAAPFVEMLTSHSLTRGQLLYLASQTDLNIANIDLVGLAIHGLLYEPG